jgi:hypothetical protein
VNRQRRKEVEYFSRDKKELVDFFSVKSGDLAAIPANLSGKILHFPQTKKFIRSQTLARHKGRSNK